MQYLSKMLNHNPHSSQIAEQNGNSHPLETALQETQTRLQLLNSIFTSLKLSMSVEQVIVCTLGQLHRYFPQVRVAYSTLTDKGQLRVLTALEPPGMPALTGKTVDLSVVPEYLNRLRTLTPVIVEDVSQDHRLRPLVATIQETGTQAFLEIPLQHSQQLVGLLCFNSPTPKIWSDYESITLQEAASYLEVAIQNAQAQQALQRSEERWQLALRGSNDGVWDWDIRTNEVYFSPRWKSMLGFEDHEISNHLDEWGKRVHPDDLEWVTQAIQDHFAQKTPFYITEHRVLCKDGSYKWILDRGQALWDEAGNAVRMAGSHTDVTERRELEAALQKANQELEQRVAERTAELEQVNATLAQQEALYRTLAKHIPNGTVHLFDRDLRYLLSEGSELASLGLMAEEMVGKTIWEVLPMKTCEQIEPLYQAALRGEARVEEVAYGDCIYQVHTVPVRNEQGKIFAGMVLSQNITAHKQTEAALRNSEQQLRRVLDSLFSFVGVMTPDGTLIQANETALVAASLQPQDVLGKVFPDTYWWSYCPTIQAQLWEAIKRATGGETVRYDVQVRVGKNRFVIIDFALVPLFDFQGKVEYLIPSGIDITERLQAETALKESEQRYRHLAEAMPQMVWTADATGAVNYFNQRWYEYSGLTTETSLGLKGVETVHPEEQERTLQQWADSVIAGEPFEIQYRVRRFDGIYRWFIARGLPLRDSNGQVTSWIGTITDIDDQKRIQAEIEAVLESIPDPFFMMDRQWRFLYINQHAEEFIGKRREELIGQVFNQVFPEINGTKFQTENQRVIDEGITVEYEEYNARLNRWLQVRAFPSRLGVSVHYRDLTERKQTEAALQETTAILNTINESTPTLIFVKDCQGRMLMANPVTMRLLGKTEAEVIGKTDLEFLANREQAEQVMANDRQVMETGQTIVCEETVDFLGVKGVYLSIKSPYRSTQGHIIGLIGISIDITERKRIEDALRESEEFSRSVLESSADCVKVLTAEGLLLSMNYQGMCLMEIDDFTPLINQPWLSFWQEPYHEAAAEAIATAKAGKVGRFQGFCPTFKGTPKWWDVLVTPVLDAEGKLKLLLSTSRDITEIRRAEAEREKLLEREQIARAEAETANRIKDEFLAVLSHELRTPLNPILGWSRLLQTRKFSQEKTQDALATIERNAKLQIQLIEDLLDISRILRGKLTLELGVVDLVNPIVGAIETLRLAAEARAIQIETIFEGESSMVKGDAGRLQQIIWNLLSNAVKFTPSGGRITVKLTTINRNLYSHAFVETLHCLSLPSHQSEEKNSLPTSPAPSAPPAPPIPQALIQISDTGEGIDSEFLPFVFESFRQQDSSTTRRYGGLGLGLAIVRQLVEAHGGTVKVSSAGKGQGSTFTVCLPLCPLSEQPAVESTALTLSGNLQDIHILLVDDDLDSLNLLGFILEQQGAMITVALSGREALDILSQRSFDVLVSDIGMPEMDGYELLRQVRLLPNGLNLQAIAVTAFAAESDQQLALAAGYQQHIPKPIQPEMLINAIAALKDLMDNP